MKITNKNNLPEPLYQAIVAQSQAHVCNGDVSCTELIDAPLIAWLKREHPNVEEEAEDRLWALYGSIVHGIVAEHGVDHVEAEVIAQVNGLNISGHIDCLLEGEDGRILNDWKFTSAWTVQKAKREGKPEWEKQLNVYKFLMENCLHFHESMEELYEIEIKKLQVTALCRDWGPRHRKDGLKRVEVIDIPVWSDEKIWAYMEERAELFSGQTVMIDPPICTPEERWAKPDTWAVMKKGRKSALRVLNSPVEAEVWIAMRIGEKGFDESKLSIEHRQGDQHVRCRDYCAFGKAGVCPYFDPATD
jgi:hypothetical protein